MSATINYDLREKKGAKKEVPKKGATVVGNVGNPFFHTFALSAICFL